MIRLCWILLFVLPLTAATGTRADGLVDLRLDFDGDLGTPEFTAGDSSEGEDPAAAFLDREAGFPPAAPEEEQEGRHAVVNADAQPDSVLLGCSCAMAETPQARCESTTSRNDFVLTGPPGPNRTVTYSMRVRTSLLSFVGHELVPGSSLSQTMNFRIDPIGPGSRVNFAASATYANGVVVAEPVEVNQVDVVSATDTSWEAVVRRSRSVAVGVPFDFEADLLVICGAGNSVFIDGSVYIDAVAKDFRITAPPGYTVVPEPDAASAGAVAALLVSARAGARGLRAPRRARAD